MRAKEYLNESDNRQFVEKYIPWVADQLGIQDLPQIELLDAPIDTTFGQYNPEDKSLSLVIANRNPIDVLRTLAHELTHHKQNLEGKLVPGAGETGTPQENEANANAGVVMRDFAKANPEYFGLKKSSIDEEASKTTGEKKLVIFDIDDTLVTTKTKVGVVHNGKTVKQLDSHEFTHYKLKPGETFDFGAFRDAEDFFEHAQPIAPMIEQLKNDIATGNRVVMVTARADFNSKEIFLKTFEQWHVDMSQVHVYRAGNDTDPVPIDEKKARIIRRLLNGHAYNKAIMYDDSVPNLESFVQLHNEYPGVKFYAWHVDRKGHACEYTRGHRAKDIDETIRHVKGGYKVFSKKGKNLGGPYSSHKQAAKRLGQVEYFKHMHEDKDNGLYELCDYTLVELCAGIIQHQKQDADKYGLVAAAVIDPDHNVVASISTKEGGKWKHAERNAMEKYIKRHGAIPAHSIVVTTLSPCANRMSERHGPSCTELLNDSPITRVYAGYRDPSQTHLSHDDFDVVYTQNSKIESVCKQIADCFLKESAYTDPANYCGEGVAEGKLIESAVFLNPTTVIVGQAHGQPLELSPNTLKQIQAIAAKHGAYYEGNGTDRAYTKGQIDRYIGSWDDEVAKTASPNDPKWVYVLFANVDANNRVQRVGIDPKDTIFNRLLATAKDNSFQGIGYTSQALQKFLQMSSEGQYDFVKMSQQPATQENLTRFLKAGEALMWPSNWEQYPNKAGKIAKAATVDVRDQYLATRKAGVYVTGSGHLKAVQNITGKQSVAEGRENYNGVNILFQKDDDEIFVKASAGGRELGHVLFVVDGDYLAPQDLEVEERYRGQGIAQTMYDYVKSKGYKIRRSGQQTDAGAGFWDKHKPGKNIWEQGVAEGFPQPGPSSGAPKQFGPDAKIQTRQMTVKDIISSVPGVPYYNNVVDDWDAKDYNSWNTTEKVIEYATYLKDHPESLAKLPPIIVLNGKFEDGAHRVSAIWLLQQRMDPKNPLWKNAKLNVQFVKQGVAENFADGKNPGRKGLAKRSGVNTKASVSSLRKTARHSTGEKARMAHWLANMKAGRAKKK